MRIRPCNAADCSAICDIYNHYVKHTIITFEETPVDRDQMEKRVLACTQRYPWLVAEHGERIVGYAYGAQWNAREAYRHSAEVSVYLDHAQLGKGYGKALYQELLYQLTQREVHTALAAIALPNASSVALQESLGFDVVGEFKQVGKKLGQWVDVGYWQKMLVGHG